MKSPIVNAYCNGDGVFVLTVGLLGALRNESELAFILAHEIAHYELDHVRYRTVQIAKSKFASKAQESSKKIMTSKDDATTFGEIDSLRKMVYNMYDVTRQQEIQADSLGLVYMKNAGYSESQCASALSSLNPEYSKYKLGARLFDPLHFNKYPFQSYWLDPLPRVYTKKRDHVFIFSIDSIHSHPDIEHRITLLQKYFNGSRGSINQQDSMFINQVIRYCELETMESCLKGQYLDFGLLHGLQLKAMYPRNDFVTSRIAQVFIDLYRYTDDNQKVLPKFVSYYGEELQTVNAFLNNLRMEEMGEMAFHFMNKQGNFNVSCEEHYYILWQICDLTNRNTVKEKILENYLTRFGKKGTYYDKMN